MVIPNEEYRFLGPTGLRVSSISLGGWITFGGNLQMEEERATAIIDHAYKAGINYFDTAEGYGAGASELLMGKIFKQLGWKRTDYVVSTKLYNDGSGNVNRRGLSRKHLIEGLDASLERLQLDYVDIVFAHRPDRFTPYGGSCSRIYPFDQLGKAHYWGTSMWSNYEIQKAHHIADKYQLIAQVVEQPLYNLLERDYFEKDLGPVFEDYGYGTTVFSPLATGLLTGKYNTGKAPEGSRYSSESLAKAPDVKRMAGERLSGDKAEVNLKKVEQLAELAKELGVEVAPLALAWCLKNKNVSTLITGATKVEQIDSNLKAYEVLPLLTDEVMEKIEKIADNKPVVWPEYGRL